MKYIFDHASVKANFVSLSIAFSIALAFVALVTPIATAANTDEVKTSRLLVGNQSPDISSLPKFTFSDGNLQPVKEVEKDRHRLVVLCNSEGGDLATGLFKIALRSTALEFKGVQLCVVVLATPDELSAAIAEQSLLAVNAVEPVFSDALLIAADREMIRETLLVKVGEPFPGVDLKLLPNDPDDEPVTPAILIGKEGLIEWVGDIAWAGRPMDQLVSRKWDRSVTEMACRLSEALFFDMRFLADVSRSEFRTYYDIPLESNFWITRLWEPAVDSTRPQLIDSQTNYSKPLLPCIKAEAKGQRDDALRLLGESTLGVTVRLLSMDQYWDRRSAVSFIPSLKAALAANLLVSAEVSDSEMKAKLETQQQSLRRWLAILRAAEAGDLKTFESLVAGWTEAELDRNRLGVLRSRIEVCLACSRPEAVDSLRQVLEIEATLVNFSNRTVGSGVPGYDFRPYIFMIVRNRVFQAKPISIAMRSFLCELRDDKALLSGSSMRQADLLFRDGR